MVHAPPVSDRAAPAQPCGCALSLVVPTYNEAGTIGPLIRAVDAALQPVLGRDWELIVVDDASPDGTAEVVTALLAEYSTLRLVRRVGERELATAVLRGYQTAHGETLGTINSDFQHPPSLLPTMIQHLKTADLVVATRYAHGGRISGWPVRRRLAATAARLAGRIFLPQVFNRVSDPLSGYYLFHRRCIANADLKPLGFKTLVEIMGRGSVASVAECGYEFRARRTGTSKLRFRDCLAFMRHLGQLRRALR